jgi:hypothetical protein
LSTGLEAGREGFYLNAPTLSETVAEYYAPVHGFDTVGAVSGNGTEPANRSPSWAIIEVF